MNFCFFSDFKHAPENRSIRNPLVSVIPFLVYFPEDEQTRQAAYKARIS